MESIERHTAPDEAKVVGDAPALPDRLGKLLALEQVLAVRLGECSVRETAGISRELRDCWREIEELTAGDDVGSDSEDDELAARRERIADARRAAAKAAAGP